jgi:DNA-binding transcriptional ArsR family regulator
MKQRSAEMTEEEMPASDPKLLWDWGTAYDMFISLEVLHEPATFGLRAAWAAGMRSRLPTQERETLEQFQNMKFAKMPFHWLYELPEPKDGRAVLRALGELSPEARLPAIVLGPEVPEPIEAVLSEVASKSTWDESHINDMAAYFEEKYKEKGHTPKRESMELMLEWWSDLAESGERLLSGLRTYHEVFFAEEENRIRPALQEALGRAQTLSQNLSVTDLLEELSQGVRLDEGIKAPELVLAPSFWGAPLIIFGKVAKQREIILFGARPLEASLVPGEVVPDALLRALKALSDSTRLRILRYLAEEPLTPSQLSRRLRLRSSTVVHHLDVLRLATLVQFRVGKHDKDRRYAARQDAISAIFAALEGFLGQAEAIEVEQLESAEKA